MVRQWAISVARSVPTPVAVGSFGGSAEIDSATIDITNA